MWGGVTPKHLVTPPLALELYLLKQTNYYVSTLSKTQLDTLSTVQSLFRTKDHGICETSITALIDQ